MVKKKTANPVGRPKEYDLKKLGRDIIAWCQKEDSWNLCGFCADYLIPASMIIAWSKKDEEFSQSYEIAKLILARRRERDLSRGKLHVKAYDLNATCYDKFLKDERTDLMRIEHALMKDAACALAEGDQKKYDDIQEMLRGIQEQFKRKPSAIIKAKKEE